MTSDNDILKITDYDLRNVIANAIGGHIWTKDALIDALIPIRDRLETHLTQKKNG